jgi:hypothetical protein
LELKCRFCWVFFASCRFLGFWFVALKRGIWGVAGELLVSIMRKERLHRCVGPLSSLVGRRSAEGYVSRVEDDEDRRAVRIQATDAGRELYATIRADLIAEERAMIENLSAEARQGALSLLRQITRATEIRCGLVSECCPAVKSKE